MPHIKYLQPLADIEDRYSDWLDMIEKGDRLPARLRMLESDGWTMDDKELILREQNVLRFLIGRQNGFVHGGPAYCPYRADVESCFHRHLTYLDETFGCNADTVRTFTDGYKKMVAKEYHACRYYLFQFSLPGWVEKLPERIQSVEELRATFV